MRSILRHLALTALLICANPASGWTASSNDGRTDDGRAELKTELAAGGLIFSSNLNLALDQHEIMISSEVVQASYAIRNRDASDHTITIAFPFPDVDGNASSNLFSKLDPVLADGWPANFMDMVIAVDGRRPTYALEQRAIAVGLDITKVITDAGLPLFPQSVDLSQRVADLDAAVRSDLIERGILKVDDDIVSPGWAVKTTAYWRQPFPAGQTLSLVLTYKPFTGRNAFSSGALQPLKKAACIDVLAEQSIMRLASEGAPLDMVAVGYLAHPGAEALGPAGRFRLTVETPTVKSIVATCRQGLSKTSPTTNDWVATDYALDEEFRFLIVH
jgi:Domain of unknown function (DUF4424)